MSFKHETYRLAFSEGGFNGGDNYDLIPESAMVDPSRNIDLHNGLREKRMGTSKDNAVAITGAPKCLGIGQYVPATGAPTLLSAHSDGKVWQNETSTIATGMSTSNRFDITQAGTIAIICDGVTTPQVWTGSGSTAAITHPATDWSGTNQPKFTLVHSRGASRRLVAGGVPGNESAWYLGKLGDYQDFQDANVLKFVGEFGDAKGLVGAVDFNQDLFLFGNKRTLIFNDSDTSTANWGWQRAPWEGGAAHQKLIIKVDNDVFVMSPDGNIYSIRTVAQVNDYKKASITRPAYIHRWMQQFVDLTKINEFHVSYDPNLRALLWWVVRLGQTTADTCMVYFMDRAVDPTLTTAQESTTQGNIQAWAIWDGVDNTASGYRATASCKVQNADGSFSVKTGDMNGFIWTLGTVAFTDDSNGYTQKIRTPWLAFKNPRNEKRYIRAEIHFIVSGAYPVSVRWFVDDAEQAGISSTVGGSGNVFPLTFGTSAFGAAGMGQVDVQLGAIGRRIMFELSNGNANQNIRFADLLIDFEDRGPRYL